MELRFDRFVVIDIQDSPLMDSKLDPIAAKLSALSPPFKVRDIIVS